MEDAATFVKQLKRQEGKDICLMGRGGIPAFHRMSRQINLELVTSRAFKNGCVPVTYRVKHQEGRTVRRARHGEQDPRRRRSE